MLTLHTKLASSDTIDGVLELRYEQREKCRLRAKLASGEEVGIFMARGSVLRDGDLITGEGGRVIRVLAAAEPVYLVRCADPLVMARCAFHLGNRHTQVQIAEAVLRIRVDPVLRDMVEGLGAVVDESLAAFEPESGAYSGAGHSHERDHLLAPVPLRQKIHRPGDASAP